jgi:hypothetical protein
MVLREMIQVNLTAIVLKHDSGFDSELWSGGTTRVDQFFFQKESNKSCFDQKNFKKKSMVF